MLAWAPIYALGPLVIFLCWGGLSVGPRQSASQVYGSSRPAHPRLSQLVREKKGRIKGLGGALREGPGIEGGAVPSAQAAPHRHAGDCHAVAEHYMHCRFISEL